MGLIEKYGSGIGRIVNYFKSEGLPVPEFRNISDGFQVTVFARKQLVSTEKVGVKVGVKVGEKVGEKITENQQMILFHIDENQHINALELASIIGISKRKIEENLSKLKAKGLIERIGPDKGGYWKVNR